MSQDCHNLDAYLSNDLSASDFTRFEDHLGLCEACREIVDQQNWIDTLLQSPLRTQLEPVPDNLIQQHTTATPPSRRRVLFAACGLASAATLLIALSLWQLNRQALNNPSETSNSRSALPPADEKPAPAATFVGGPDVLAIPIASRNPNVTIVQIYPTYQPPQEEKTVAAYSNAATNSTWPDYYNGG